MRQITGKVAPGLYLGGSLVQGLAAALIIPLARPLLGAEAWGTVGVSLSIIQIGTVVLSTGLPMSITRAYFDPTEGPDVARAIHGAMASIGAIVTAFALVATVWSGSAGVQTGQVAGLVGAILGLQVMVSGGLAALRARRAAHWFVIVSLMSALAPHLLGVTLATVVGASATVYLVGFAIVVGLTAILVAILVRPTLDRKHRDALRPAFRLGFPMVPHSLGLIAMAQGPVIAIAVIGGAPLAGEFYVVQVLATGSIQVMGALNNVWVTDILEAAPEIRQAAFTRTVRSALGLGAALTLAGSAAAPFVLRVLASDRPAFGVPGAILPAVAVAYVVYLQCNTLMFAEKRTALMAALTPAVSVVSLVLVAAAATTSNLTLMGVAYVVNFWMLAASYFLLIRWWRIIRWPNRELVVAVVAALLAIATTGLADDLRLAAGRAVVLAVVAFIVLRNNGLRASQRSAR